MQTTSYDTTATISTLITVYKHHYKILVVLGVGVFLLSLYDGYGEILMFLKG